MAERWYGYAALVVFATAVIGAQPAADPRVADLVRTGKLTVALYLPQYTPGATPDTVSRFGAVGSVLVELVKGIAKPLGVRVELVGLPHPPATVACLKTHRCDFALMGPDETRDSDLDFTQPIIEIDYTYLVPPGSTINTGSDVDRAGVRVAGVRDHASTLALSRLLKNATMVTAPTPDETFALLQSGKADVLVSIRTALQLIYAPRLSGSRVLDDKYGFNPLAIAMAKGQDGRLSYLNEFVARAKQSGEVQQIVDGFSSRAMIRVAQ
jgi:polar amino acid transport system substrate-binding protein